MTSESEKERRERLREVEVEASRQLIPREERKGVGGAIDEVREEMSDIRVQSRAAQQNRDGELLEGFRDRPQSKGGENLTQSLLPMPPQRCQRDPRQSFEWMM